MTANDVYAAIKYFIPTRHQNAVIGELERLFANITTIEWCVDDVHLQANRMNIALTPSEAKQVLDLLDSEHDASTGVTWDTIEYHINNENVGRPLADGELGLERLIIAQD